MKNGYGQIETSPGVRQVKKPIIEKSNEIYGRAVNVIPAGTQTYSKGVTQFVEGFAPKYLKRGKGAYVWDVDGNKYLDYIMGCHPIILGYADPDVNQAVMDQLQLGSTFSLMNELEVDVAELLIEAVPCAEGARFGKNGADATSAGVRIARAVTGRDHIAYCGYHGWHDWYIANTDLNNGIPRFNQELAHSFVFNDLDSLEKIFKDNPDKIAIVIMEPLTILEPKGNFLEDVKGMAHHHGALLMFDEIITGFRFSFGGAQELTGVTPDLTALAKAVSNGIPLSAIVGKKEYIFSLEKTFFSFTYGGDCVGLSAAKACIPKLKREKVSEHLWEVGAVLKNGFNSLAEQYGLTEFVQCIGYPCRTIISFDGCGRYDELEMKSYFQQELIRRGILWTAYHAICFSHKAEDIAFSLECYEDVLRLFKKIVDGKKAIRPMIEGEPVKPVFRKVADFNAYTLKSKEQNIEKT
jgi:glutamate-1-semialdehyde 2,1-aminomutase/spore coat polysaccharide biosynthesis protein SpsF